MGVAWAVVAMMTVHLSDVVGSAVELADSERGSCDGRGKIGVWRLGFLPPVLILQK